MSEKCHEADTGTHPSCLYALEGISIAPQLALAATANYVRGRDLEAPRRSERAKELNQIALLLAGQARRLLFFGRLTRATSRRSVCVHRQRELKHGAVGHGCRGPQPAAMGLHDRAADRKSHTHAAGFGGEEGVEQPVHILGGDPDAAIRHTDERLAWFVLS